MSSVACAGGDHAGCLRRTCDCYCHVPAPTVPVPSGVTCEDCGRDFSSAQALGGHKKIHTRTADERAHTAAANARGHQEPEEGTMAAPSAHLAVVENTKPAPAVEVITPALEVDTPTDDATVTDVAAAVAFLTDTEPDTVLTAALTAWATGQLDTEPDVAALVRVRATRRAARETTQT